MKRNALDKLLEWKNSSRRKPLMLDGARQVGKTWLAKEFGRLYYEDTFYFTFDAEGEDLSPIFNTNKNPGRIVELLGALREKVILPEKHLIIFDEVQECPEAMNSLKYFCEDANEYHIISAGSLLGTCLAQPMSYPVGKVNIINVYPLTFDEFLAACGGPLYAAYNTMNGTDVLDKVFHNRMLEAYSYYLIVGGMPECVAAWTEMKDYAKVKEIQGELVALYERDVLKHHGRINCDRILLVLRSVVSQLAKENEKFIYGCLKEGARAREFEGAIEWLVSAGILIRTHNVSKPECPLNAFQLLHHFKLFMFDVGLLKYMSGLPNEVILLKSDHQFKGPLTENYILQQIRSLFDSEPNFFSHTASSQGEIDFLLQNGMDIIPVEVKAGESVKANSFKNYIDKYAPAKAIRYSKLEYRKTGAVTNIPLYLAGKTKELI
ncbi:MAG: ATP-binding protein [Chitinispirillia bacterium]|nr:ATP-binding protein [Chitinispirillia bacterium]MCL2268531.1 ATP-binding protein [Chitinispirillia bacterium]